MTSKMVDWGNARLISNDFDCHRMSIKGSMFFKEGPILHQLVKMKAFIVISFTLASLVVAAPDSSSGKNAFSHTKQ